MTRPNAKRTLLSVLSVGGFFSAIRYVTSDRLRVLAYHGVEHIDGIVNGDGFQVDPEMFSRQLDHVASRYNVISLSEAITGIEQSSWPNRAVLLTFDDGYLNNLEIAAPILRQRGLPAVFFVTTGYIDQAIQPWWYVVRKWISRAGAKALGLPPVSKRPAGAITDMECLVTWENYLKGLNHRDRNLKLSELSNLLDLPHESGIKFMNWDHVRALRDKGFDIGPHTVRHINLGSETPGETVSEINTSIDKLERELGRCPGAYSYPYGRMSDIQPEVLSTLRCRNIKLGLTTISGMNKPGSNGLLMRRLNVTGNHQGASFEKLLATG